jgi:hypothetical protein
MYYCSLPRNIEYLWYYCHLLLVGKGYINRGNKSRYLDTYFLYYLHSTKLGVIVGMKYCPCKLIIYEEKILAYVTLYVWMYIS